MSRELQLILGPPGTGKTTRLLDIVDKHLQEGIRPERIAFVSFTKKAANEAAERAMLKFNLNKNDFINFRTLHSLAYSGLGVSRDEVMNKNDYKKIAKMVGVQFSGYADMADGLGSFTTATEGDVMLQMCGLACAKKVELKAVWAECGSPFDWYKLKQFADTVHSYKNDIGKLDFDDMLSEYEEENMTADIDIAIIDEAQDLSNAQWDMAKQAFRKAKKIYVAGDDDQAIYEWSGANVERFLNISGEQSVLPLSYRLPEKIYNLAQSITKMISNRYEKEWLPKDKSIGSVQRLSGIENLQIDLCGQSWYLLARNSLFLKDYEDHCKSNGIPYMTARGSSINAGHVRLIQSWERLRAGKEITEHDHMLIHESVKSPTIPLDKIWHDALIGIPLEDREYYLSILRAGRRLQDDPSVYIGTIHSVKGGEADNVVLRRDITYKTATSYDLHPDNEHRVFYVGVTRARENLYIMDPQGDRSYLL